MRKTLLLLGSLLLIAIVYFVFVFDKGGSSLKPQESDFSIADTQAIQRITMRAMKDGIELTGVVLERDPEGGWLLNHRHKAVEPRVNTLLETLHLMRVRGTLSEAGKEKGLHLINQRHIQVQVFGQDGLIKSFKVGPQTRDAKGTTMLMDGSETPYIVGLPGFDGYLNPRFSLEYDRWRENLLFDAVPEQLSAISMDYQEAGRSWKLVQQGGKWSLSGVEAPADSAAIQAYLALFKGKVYGESFAETFFPNKIDTLSTQTPDIRLSLTYQDGQSRSLLLYKRQDNLNNFFGWIEGEKELITVQHFVFDPYLVERSRFVEN